MAPDGRFNRTIIDEREKIMTLIKKLAICLGILFVLAEVALAKGYLATRAIRLPDLVLGTDNTGFGLSQKEYRLETGKAYRLKIVSTGMHEYAMVAPEFFDFIWLRKVEAGGMEIKANSIYELEFENEAEAEIFFVPIKPGSYKMKAKGLEIRGVEVKFIVK